MMRLLRHHPAGLHVASMHHSPLQGGAIFFADASGGAEHTGRLLSPEALLEDRNTAEPGRPRVLLATTLGCAVGVIAAITVFPAVPALMFGAAVGAYTGFLATAIDALGSGDLPD